MLSYYDGQILNADNDLKPIAYKDTEIYSIYRHFLECPEKCKSIYLMIKYCIFENSIYVTNTPPDRGEGRILRPFFMPWSVVIYVLANSFALAWESTRSAALLLGLEGGIFIHDIRRRSKADLESVWGSSNRFFC